jgi:hypothetical protein
MKISVAMCTFNGAPYIEEQLQSFERQSRPPDEVVICDDGSTDETIEILRDWADRCGLQVRIEQNSRRLGSTANFDRAISLCSGELIALADQDDVWLPRKLEVIEARFIADLQLAVLFSDAELVDEQLRPLGRRLWESVGFGQREQGALVENRYQRLLLKSFITGATLAFRSDLRSMAQPFPTDLPRFIHDRWIGLVGLAVSGLGYEAEPLLLNRQHSAQQIGAAFKRDSRRTRIAQRFRHDRAALLEELKGLQRLRDRLASCGGPTDPTPFERSLEERIAFLEMQTQLGGSRLQRIPVIARNLMLGRYHRFASGVPSAVKDLISGARA